MRTRAILAGLATFLAAASSVAQSDGGRFDAAVVLTPGMTLERGAVIVTGGYQSGLLRHGDVIYTDNLLTGRYHILTTDGTVIGLNGGTTMVIDGRRNGFDVFQVVRGWAGILGNVNRGYPMPLEFAAVTPIRVGRVIFPSDPDPFVEPITVFPRVLDLRRR